MIILPLIRVLRGAGGVSNRRQDEPFGPFQEESFNICWKWLQFLFICMCVSACASHQPVDDSLDGVEPLSDQRLRLRLQQEFVSRHRPQLKQRCWQTLAMSYWLLFKCTNFLIYCYLYFDYLSIYTEYLYVQWRVFYISTICIFLYMQLIHAVCKTLYQIPTPLPWRRSSCWTVRWPSSAAPPLNPRCSLGDCFLVSGFNKHISTITYLSGNNDLWELIILIILSQKRTGNSYPAGRCLWFRVFKENQTISN